MEINIQHRLSPDTFSFHSQMMYILSEMELKAGGPSRKQAKRKKKHEINSTSNGHSVSFAHSSVPLIARLFVECVILFQFVVCLVFSFSLVLLSDSTNSFLFNFN